MLEIRGASPGLLDDPLLLEVRGAEPGAALRWRARLRDDEGFVWRAEAATSQDLPAGWRAAKRSAGPVAALRSLRPVALDVRVEAPDGAAASRTITRAVLGDGVKVRRWRDGVTGTLHRPAQAAASALVLDASDGSGLEAAGVVAALLASRGVLVFVVAAGDPAAAGAVLAALPAPAPVTRPVTDVPLPPGLPGAPAGAAAAWDALLAELGAHPRRVGR